MKKQTLRWLAALPLLLGAVAAVAGCQHEETNKTAPLSLAGQIRLIQNDPKMPADAKAIAIQQLRGQASSVTAPPRPPNHKP
ncbi:MAG TPA: hypothetical protein VKT32_07560 [Chthonomonadaceae bacterium]|nr:hypothetical protein [Chthonomonadaceae bacterium]